MEEKEEEEEEEEEFLVRVSRTYVMGFREPGLRLRPRAQDQTSTLMRGRNVWHTDCVVKDDLREIYILLIKGVQ